MKPKDTREYYDEFSLSYEKHRAKGYHALLDELEAAAVCRNHGVGPLLEAGCGTGLILNRLKSIGLPLVGVDLSGGMLRRARERGYRVVQGTLTALPFRDGTFGTVCSFKVLAHVEDIRSALLELCRVARPGGVLALEFYNRRSLRYLLKRAKPPSKISGSTTDEQVYTRYDTEEEILSLLPEDLSFMGRRGVRIFTPFAFLHRVPLLGALLRLLERKGSASAWGRYGGFLILLFRKMEPGDSTGSS